jgi:hypothetical protein
MNKEVSRIEHIFCTYASIFSYSPRNGISSVLSRMESKQFSNVFQPFKHRRDCYNAVMQSLTFKYIFRLRETFLSIKSPLKITAELRMLLMVDLSVYKINIMLKNKYSAVIIICNR